MEHPYMVDKSGEPFMVAMDSTLEDHNRHERIFVLARSALLEVLEKIPSTSATTLPIYLGLPEFGPFYSQHHAHALCQRLAAEVSWRCKPQIVPVTEGDAAGLAAMERAVAGISDGMFQCCIVGGVDSFLDPDILESLDDVCRVASIANRWGFPPGEGAGMLAVCSPEFARVSCLHILGWVVSLASTVEKNPINTKTICLGTGLAKVMQKAAGVAGNQVTKQYCDINGERYREHEFSYAILRVPPPTFVNSLDYVSPVDCWGHNGAATGPLLSLLPLVCHNLGFSPGQWPMVWCGSENGRRGAMVLHLQSGDS
ncbi:MAG: hypothetical protein KAT58_06200 [candidate division Zixibacteria bacterium]|nr:hypothetical protein [candidate division Zixibacteria bacterium]